MVVPTGYGIKGIPDHVACVPVVITPEMVGQTYGMFVAVEAKAPKKHASPTQIIQITKIIKAGGFCPVTKGVAELPQLEAALRRRFGL